MEEGVELKSDEAPVLACVGKKITRLQYHDKLNVIFVGNENGELLVIDPTLGDVLYETKLSQSNWDFSVGLDKMVLISNDIVGIRSEYNGIILTNTILQTPIKYSAASQVVQIELTKVECEGLCQSFAAADKGQLSDLGEAETVEKELRSLVAKDTDTENAVLSVKKDKWRTVKLSLPHSTLKSSFQALVQELSKKNSYIPQLSVASSILERLNMLLISEKADVEAPLDKAHMFSESARLATFANWPHMDYKWALPEQMAQAGFYHNPSTTGDDRAMCFTCNVCLVSWEPTDEPWSEHERHSPFCPFVRGEHTHNVPLSLSYATAPAFIVKNPSSSLGNSVLGNSSFSTGVAVGYTGGLIVVWDIAKQAKEAVRFELKVKELESLESTAQSSYCDVELKPKEAWVMEMPDASKHVDTECRVNLTAEDKILLSAISLLGPPITLCGEAHSKHPPSVIIGGTLERKAGLTDESITRSPVILVYGLNSNSFAKSEDTNKSTETFKTSGNTGTKQDTQTYDEDIYGSFMSESDMMSDSISIFSDLNMSDSSGTFVLDPPTVSTITSAVPIKKKGSLSVKKIEVPGKAKAPIKLTPAVKITQKVVLPSDIQYCSIVKSIVPSLDGVCVLISVESRQTEEKNVDVCGALVVYSVECSSGVVLLDPHHSAMRKFGARNELPVGLCFLPYERNSAVACSSSGGDVQIFSLLDLSVLSHIKSAGNNKIQVATYCSSLERLCCGTEDGKIEFYSTGNQNGSDFGDEKSDTVNSTEDVESDAWDASSLMDWTQQSELESRLTASEMKRLMEFTHFENIVPCFTANVPSCWVKIIQAQKERKHPQHLQHHESELDSTTLSWRLQRNKNSKREHLFEITLPKATYVGHLDIKFLLQMGCVSLPTIEVTLYRVAKKKPKPGSSSVDKSIDFGGQLKSKASTNEFLKSINAKVVCGPLDLGSNVDLSSQGGNLVMTSPALMLTKGRNFYLQIRAKSVGKSASDSATNAGTSATKSSKSKTEVTPKAKSSSSHFPKLPKTFKDYKDDMQFYDNKAYNPFYLTQHHRCLYESFQSEIEKKKDCSGCDWLHEISISIRQIKSTSIPHELAQRKTMLTSSHFLSQLLDAAVFEGEESSFAAQNCALDLLVWIAAVNLCGPPTQLKCGYQTTFLKAVQPKLSSLILHCILLADRAVAHKCSRLFVLCIDSVEANHNKSDSESFLFAMLSSLLTLLPYTITCTSAGSLQWFFLLLNRVRTQDLGLTSEALLNLLNEVSGELSKRIDPIHAVLRARFGLYGTPFEPELFELELPPVTKSYSHPLTYAGMCGVDNAHMTSGAGVFHLWGLKDVDFRDLLIGNPLSLRWGKVGLLAPKQQIQGLLEVEPLHFTCHAASDGTRIEKIDLGITPTSSSAVPLPQPWEPFTNMPTGEGSKKSEPDKMEQIMLLQKAFKMDQGEAYFDVLNDLKFMESNVNLVEVPYHVSNDGNITVQHHLTQMPLDSNAWKNVGVKMVLHHPSENPMLSSSDPSKYFYDNFTQPALASSSYSFNPIPMDMSPTVSPALKPSTISSAKAKAEPQPSTSKAENDGLRLLLSPWQQMMYVPPQQVLVIDRMHSGARRFVVLDFGSPILLTDMVIPSCNYLVSLSIDTWLQREELDGQRLIVASDIGMRSLVICDLQPPPVCRYLKITTIGRYGMGTTKCRIPVGMFYGHTAILPTDLRGSTPAFPCDVPVLSAANIQANLSVLSYLVEDIGCRYQLSCAKLKRLIEPLMKPEISSLDHTSYYLPKGKERNKLGLNSLSDQTILSSYQECITLQQQLNVAKNVIRRLQRSLLSRPDAVITTNPLENLSEICADKVHVINEFLIESLLGISFLASNQSVPSSIPYSLYTNMNQSTCENYFRNICVLENGQCQLSTCTLLLRVCGFQPWWGKFLTSTLKNLFKCSSTSVFPQDRVFILLVYLGQKSLASGQNSGVLESAMDLLQELLSPLQNQSGFLRSNVDMTLLGWVIMFLCMCLDGVSCTVGSGFPAPGEAEPNARKFCTSKGKEYKDTKCISSRWDFIQGESALYRKVATPQKGLQAGGFKRRIQKKILATKQKLEELDTVAAGLGYSNQQTSGLGTQLTALGNKIEAIKQKQASIGKTIKIQSSKVNSIQQFKDLLQMRRSEMLFKRGLMGANRMNDNFLPSTDVEINLSLNPSLCFSVAKGLSSLLLRMDSTCHSDMFLITCKALARIATSCRPTINLGAVFNSEQCIRLILAAVGSDYVRQKNWSTSWVSHAVMCLIEDILEGERLYPSKPDEHDRASASILEDIMAAAEEVARNKDSNIEDTSVDDVDAVNEILGSMDTPTPMESTLSLSSEDTDMDDGVDEFFSQAEHRHHTSAIKKYANKRLTPCVTSISTALDARLEYGVESTTELRLRLMSVVDSEVLTQSFKSVIEVPPEILKGASQPKPVQPTNNPPDPVVSENSLQILASSFDQIFLMMASENCSISIEKVLQLWISINNSASANEDSSCVVPSVPLSRESIKALMSALTKNTGIGVQEWGLGFQCLLLASNQKAFSSYTGNWLDILTSPFFPQMILRFISGSGMNLQKSNIVSAGPTVCQHFYNFLLRLRELSSDTPWTPCLKEILLRILGIFLAGPFLNADFPLDAFNKFLDRVTCPDLSYENPATVVSIMEQFGQILHLFVFFPNKMNIRSNAENKGAQTTTTATSNNPADMRIGRTQTLEHVMFRLVSLMTSIITLNYKSESMLDSTVKSTLQQMSLYSDIQNYDIILATCVEKCGGKPRTIGDLVLQMEPTMMRILSVLANPNGINVLVSGDILDGLSTSDSTPATVVDSVIHLFSKLCSSASQPNWTIQPLFKFLSKSVYDDFCCPLIVSETFVLMILQVIDNDANLKQFTDLKCVESVCDKLVSSTRKFFSSCPTFVSILTQYIGRTDCNAIFGHKKLNPAEPVESLDGLINVAPLGTITSNNFSAHPSEVLLQAYPPHRRARTPVWSYHFFPEECFLELIVTLPCAILLKEVQIVPHVTSLSTSCPAALMVEISRDRSNLTVPMGPPVQCGGMSSINIQLTQPEVAQTVLLRLFKPKDSSNLGLSQIRLMGSTTFSEAAMQGLSQNETAQNLESSAHWMYILDRAISAKKTTILLKQNIIETALNTPDILEASYSMLMAPASSGKVQDIYLPHVASVLFHFGSLRKDVSDQLMSALLGPVQTGFSRGMVANSNIQSSACLSQLNTVVELIYKLCCDVPDWGYENLVSLFTWMEFCADEAIQGDAKTKTIMPEYVQASAASLWTINATGKTDISKIVTSSLLKKLLDWSRKLDPKCDLKSAIDQMICSLCVCKPWLFVYIMFKLEIVHIRDTADSDSSLEDRMESWCGSGSVWGNVGLLEISQLKERLIPGSLLTLARAVQSPSATQILQSSKFLDCLNTIIMDFWRSCTSQWVSGAMFEHKDQHKTHEYVTSTPLVIAILEFFGELSRVNEIKNWLGNQGSVFWLPILNLLSTLPGNLKASFYGVHVYDLETAVINFLTKCCWSHPENQKIVATCLCEIILKQKATPHKAVFLHSMSSFCRRLLIQLLLENEKMVVHVKCNSKLPLKCPQESLPLKDRHPSMGVNGEDRIFLLNFHSTVWDLMKAIEPLGTSSDKLFMSAADSNRFLNQLKREQGIIEAGMDNLEDLPGVSETDQAIDTKRPIRTATKKLKPDGPTDSKNSLLDPDAPRNPILILECEAFPNVRVPPLTLLSGVMAAVRRQKPDSFLNCLVFSLRMQVRPKESEIPPRPSTSSAGKGNASTSQGPHTEANRLPSSVPEIFEVSPLPSTIEVFSRLGGLGLLAKLLPVVYPETLRQIAVGSKFTGSYGVVMNTEKESPIGVSEDWVKVENADDFYEEMLDSMMASSSPSPKRNMALKHLNASTGIPPHSMAAFGLFLSLPRYPEVLLAQRIGAQCMLRLVMGVTDDADGNDIFATPIAKTLPVLPFQVLRNLLDCLAVNSDEGIHVRKAMVDSSVIHFILACLAVFTHQNCDPSLVPGLQHELVIAATKAQGGYSEKIGKSDDKSHVYWAKGTGFGTGSTAQSWDIELAMQKKKAEEEHVTCLLLVLSSFINPKISHGLDRSVESEDAGTANLALPLEMFELLKNSSLFPAIAGYLRNDSVLDMARHVPLYKSVLLFLRSLVASPQLVELLAPWEKSTAVGKDSDDQTISCLLSKMKDVVDGYSKRLINNSKKSKGKTNGKLLDDLEDEGLALLIPDIQCTAVAVEVAVNEMAFQRGTTDMEIGDENTVSIASAPKTLQERYLDEMRKLQFAFHEMIVEEEETGGIRFTVSHHYEGNVRANSTRSFPTRLKRLAQENVTLSTSLPIAYGSTIFVRCDTDRLDVMKVLITGPEATPYANGCFEFDVYFPNDYPNSPMMINLETNGRQRVRFNPNLYTDGKVCLSILNTWHGRPEEKWNPQTSSLLPVLVAIQSLILNAEPYFNEPGYEKSRGTDAGERNSREYNAGIEIATVEWAMLDQIRHPSLCFKDVIHRHFWMKRAEIIEQCEHWLEELVTTCRNDKRAGKNVTGHLDPVTVLKNNLSMLKKEFSNMKPPPGLEDMGEIFESKVDTPTNSSAADGPVVNHVESQETSESITTKVSTNSDGTDAVNEVPENSSAPDS